jgi:hypothetical protein
MRLVHAHVADFMIEPIKDVNLVRPLEHLHSTVCENEGHPLRVNAGCVGSDI